MSTCATCKGVEGSLSDGDDPEREWCYAQFGGEHAETDAYSADWAERAIRAEAALAAARADISGLEFKYATVRNDLAAARAEVERLRADLSALREQAEAATRLAEALWRRWGDVITTLPNDVYDLLIAWRSAARARSGT